MDLRKLTILSLVLFGISLISNFILGYKLINQKEVVGASSYGMPCYYSASGMVVPDGEGTAFACDINGHLIITN